MWFGTQTSCLFNDGVFYFFLTGYGNKQTAVLSRITAICMEARSTDTNPNSPHERVASVAGSSFFYFIFTKKYISVRKSTVNHTGKTRACRICAQVKWLIFGSFTWTFPYILSLTHALLSHHFSLASPQPCQQFFFTGRWELAGRTQPYNESRAQRGGLLGRLRLRSHQIRRCSK